MRAGIVTPEEWDYSSVKAHLKGIDDELVVVRPLLDLVDDWGSALAENVPEDVIKKYWKAGYR